MAGESFIISPQGNIINITGGSSPVFDQLTNEFKYGGVVEQLQDIDTLNAYKRVIIANMLASGAAINLSTFIFGTMWLSKTIQSNFLIPNNQMSPPTTVADSFILNGAGFDITKLGLVHLEDAAGGQDDNSAAYTVQFIDSFNLLCTYNTSGDNALCIINPAGIPLNIILYYRDSTGLATNNLLGTFDGLSTVTINYP